MADKVRFILSSKIGKEGTHYGKSEIHIKMYLTRTIRVQIKSGIFIYPKNFGSSEIGIVVPKLGKLNLSERNDAIEAKQELDRLVLRLSTIMDAISRHNEKELTRDSFLKTVQLVDKYEIATEDISYESIINCNKKEELALLPKEEKKEETFYESVEAFLKSKDASDDYRKHFYVTLRSMTRYEKFCQKVGEDRKNFHWDLNSVTREDIEDFSAYLKKEDKLAVEYPHIFKSIMEEIPSIVKGKNITHVITGRGDNSIVKAHKRLKQFFKWAIETGRTTNQPYTGFVIGSEHFGIPYYLSIAERNKIADFDFSNNKHLETQRDIFIFQCLIGCRVSDLVKLTAENITNGILEYVPQKTKDDNQPVKPRIPLNKRALALIEKYKGQDKRNRLFPFISTQKYNDAIKVIFKAVDITRNVQVRNAKTGETEIRPINEVASSHMARRTFVGAAYKKVKDPNLIGRMSGHVEGSKAFARYRDIDDDDLRDVISQIE